jgi:hypothetical protein
MLVRLPLFILLWLVEVELVVLLIILVAVAVVVFLLDGAYLVLL